MSSRALPVVHEESELAEDPLEPDLPWLHQQCTAVGRPTYFGHADETWSVVLDVPTGRPGCTAKIGSGYGHRTLSDAMRAALKAAGGEGG